MLIEPTLVSELIGLATKAAKSLNESRRVSMSLDEAVSADGR